MTYDLLTSRSRKQPRRAVARWTVALIGTSLVVATVALVSAGASADVPHSGCASVSVGASSGWCGLYPGNATSNVPELGQVTISADGTSLVVQTQSASSATVPATSFACLVFVSASQITQRLQNTQCAKAGGIRFPASGGSFTIDLAQYPQFLNMQFTVQVAANQSANSSNGDAFYNNFSVSTVTGGTPD